MHVFCKEANQPMTSPAAHDHRTHTPRTDLDSPGLQQGRQIEAAAAVRRKPVWPERLGRIGDNVGPIRFPGAEGDGTLDQDAEWCEVEIAGEMRRIRFHDYHEIYAIPGLYERLFYDRLACCSPCRVTTLLEELVNEAGETMKSLRVLDVGAGNGMVGDELHDRGSTEIVGIDIIPEAREAARRDRPNIYGDYHIADLTALDEPTEEAIRHRRLNAMTTVAALGFGDIPAPAFLKALDLIETPGWVAFTIKEDFLTGQETTGFSALIHDLTNRGIIRPEAYRRYQHRLGIDGQPLYYVAMVARKLIDVPDDLLRK